MSCQINGGWPVEHCFTSFFHCIIIQYIECFNTFLYGSIIWWAMIIKYSSVAVDVAIPSSIVVLLLTSVELAELTSTAVASGTSLSSYCCWIIRLSLLLDWVNASRWSWTFVNRFFLLPVSIKLLAIRENFRTSFDMFVYLDNFTKESTIEVNASSRVDSWKNLARISKLVHERRGTWANSCWIWSDSTISSSTVKFSWYWGIVGGCVEVSSRF